MSIPKDITDKYQIRNNALKRVVNSEPTDVLEIEVGRADYPDDFVPALKIKRWNDKVNFSVQLGDTPAPKTRPQIGTDPEGNPIFEQPGNFDTDKITFEGEKIKYKKDKVEAHFYEQPADAEHPEGGYEFEVVLSEKPAINTIDFNIEIKGIDFFYQPRMDAEVVAEEKSFNDGIPSNWSDPEWIKKYYNPDDRKEGYTATSSPDDFRPENVVGSYAVYTSENLVNWKGGNEYKVGKVGHIYRPKAIDANGKEVWADLHIDKTIGKMTVTIPQSFLDTAVYPVKVDPSFGYDTVGASTTTPPSNYYHYGNITNPYTANNGDTAVLLAGYGKAVTGSTGPSAGIYTIVNSLPNTKLISKGLSFGATPAWSKSTSFSTAMSAGINYNVSIGGSTNAVFYYDSTESYSYDNTGSSIPPATWSSDGTGTGTYSIYATYIPTPTANWLTGYSYRKQRFVQPDYVDENLADFPTYVRINADTDIGGHIIDTTNGYDIRFTDSDGQTLLKYERESFSVAVGAASADFWVKVPSISTSGGAVIYLYYGKASDTDGQDAVNVWDANFIAVYHFAGGSLSDSTVSGLTLTAVGNPASVAGKIGDGYSFDGNDYLYNASAPVTAAPLTYSVWALFDNLTDNHVLESIVKKPNTTSEHIFTMQLRGDTAGDPVWMTTGAAGSYGTATKTGVTATATYYYISGKTAAANSRYAYVNAAAGTQNTGSYTPTGLTEYSIGASYYNGSYINYLTGDIDEVRLSDIARSDAWLKFEYNNVAQADWEGTWTAEETAPPTGAQPIARSLNLLGVGN